MYKHWLESFTVRFRGHFVFTKVSVGLISVCCTELRGVCFSEVENVNRVSKCKQEITKYHELTTLTLKPHLSRWYTASQKGPKSNSPQILADRNLAYGICRLVLKASHHEGHH